MLIEWKSCNIIVDLVFIIDLFGSIVRRNYVKIKVFVKYFVRSFGILLIGSRVGIVFYSIIVLVKVYFGKYLIVEEFNNLVDILLYERGFMYIDKVFELVVL